MSALDGLSTMTALDDLRTAVRIAREALRAFDLCDCSVCTAEDGPPPCPLGEYLECANSRVTNAAEAYIAWLDGKPF